MKEFLESYNLLLAMTALTAVAILAKCLCAIIYQMLLRDSEQIPSTKNKWIRAMYTRFESCYKLKIPIHNPACFVKSHMEQYRFLGLSMKTLESADMLCGLIVTAATMLSIMGGIYYELPVRWILIHSMTLVFFLLFLAAGEFLFQVRHKRELLHLQLLNYFENTLQAKLERQYLHPEEQKAYQNAYFEKDMPYAGSDHTPEDRKNSKKRHTVATEPFEDEEYADTDPVSALDTDTYLPENSYTPAMSPDMQELIDSLLEESKITEELNQKQEKLQAAASSEKFRLIEEIIKEYL